MKPCKALVKTLFLLVIMTSIFIFGASTASALEFIVNSTADTVDASPGNGIAADVSGKTSLRAAIMEANATAAADVIKIPAGIYTLTRAGADENECRTGDLDVLAGLTIIGSGGDAEGNAAETVIDGGGIDKVLSVNPYFTSPFNTAIKALTIRNGHNRSSYTGDGFGGGMDWDSSGTGTLTIYNCIFENNIVDNADGGGIGLFNATYSPSSPGQPVTISKTIVRNNSVTGTGNGGGILAGYGTHINLDNCTVEGNSANSGGGIYANTNDSTGSTISNSTISANVARASSGAGQGGGLYTTNPIKVVNTTISGNSAQNGGGVWINMSSSSTAFTNVTITNNSASTQGGGISWGGGGGTLILRNTIVAGNIGSEIYGTISADSSNNLIGSAGGSGGLVNGSNFNLVGHNPKLDVLADNGGKTKTHALLAGSPAINAGSNSYIAGPIFIGPPYTDQRGLQRIVGANVDIGAFEVNKGNTAATISSSANPASYGQTVTFTAAVNAVAPAVGTPTGTVTFKDGSTVLGTVTLSGGLAAYTTSALAVNSHSIAAEYGGDDSFNTSTSSSLTQTVNKGSTVTAVSSSINPSLSGQSVTFTATVSSVVPAAGVPAGSVTFKDGSTVLSTVPLNGSGQAAYTTSLLQAGSYSISTVYSGDANYSSSTASAITQTVNKANTVNILASSTFYTEYGQPVTFTATVNPAAPAGGTPTGTITFRNGSTILGTGELSGKQAAFTTSLLPAGSIRVTAEYGGDSNFNSSTSSAGLTVTKASTTTAVTSDTNPTVYGQPVTFTASVTSAAGTPTGTVTFKADGSALGEVTLSSGQATLTISSLAVKNYNITAEYGGDGNFNGSTSVALTQAVDKGDSTIKLTSSVSTITYGEPVIFTAEVSAAAPAVGTPTGTVTFKDGSTVLGTVTLSGSGQAALTTSLLPAGSRSITAEYSGDGSFSASASSAVTQAVNKANTVTTVSSSINPSVYGQPVTFTAAVTSAAGTPAGTVTFKADGSALGEVTLSSGQATLTISSLAVRNNSIIAEYGGDVSFNSSASAALTQAVNKRDTSITVTSIINTSYYGQQVTFTASVSAAAGTPTGSVSFKNGSTLIGAGILNGSSQAVFRITTLTAGSHSITAEYVGDENYNGSSSSALAHTVNKAATMTMVSTNADPSVYGQSVTFTATVSAAATAVGIPTGSVTFKDGSTTLGIYTLDSSGKAEYSTSSLAVGSHSITADYSGDDNYSSNTSFARSQTVNRGNTSVTVISAVNPALYGQPVTFTAEVSAAAPAAGTPSGTVTFRDGSTVLGTGTLNSSGQATFTASSLPVGSRSITAEFGGDGSFSPSTSSALAQIVNTGGSTISITSSKNPAVYGEPVSFTATVSAAAPASGTPAGTVTFKDGSTTLGTVPLNGSGQASFTTSSLAAGSYNISAVYSGDTNFNTSTSSALVQIVSDITPPTVTGNISLPGNGTYKAGDELDFTVTFNEDLTVTGSDSVLGITVGSTARSASYILNTTDSITYRYVIQDGDSDSDGITVGTITLNTTLIRDAWGNNADLSLTGHVPSAAGIMADGVRPVLEGNISVPTNRIYGVGENLDFTIKFNDNVTISGNSSTLGITVGSVSRSAAYLSKTADSITYRYTLQAGDMDTDGISIGTIQLNADTIKDAAGNNANLDLSGHIPDISGVLADTAASIISGNIGVPAKGSYKAGANLDFIITFNENVSVTGTDSILSLNVGGTARNAAFLSNTTNSITYRYTVQEGDTDSDGITVGSISLNTATIKDAAGNNADLTLTGHIPGTSEVLVDTAAPTISGSIAVPGNGIYKTGANLDFEITFNENISITGNDSIFSLDVGGIARKAVYLSKTANSISYRYTVQAGDSDPDGIAIGAITLNTAVIRDLAGNDANLAMTGHIPDTSAVRIDGIIPVVYSVDLPANGYYKAGDTLAFRVNYSKNVTVTGAIYLPVNIGGLAAGAAYISGSGSTTLDFTYTVQPGDQAASGISLGTATTLNGGTIRDASGNDASLVLNGIGNTSNIIIDTAAPSIDDANPGASYTVSTHTLVIKVSETGKIAEGIGKSAVDIGKITVKNGSSSRILTPGQSSAVITDSRTITVTIGGTDYTAVQAFAGGRIAAVDVSQGGISDAAGNVNAEDINNAVTVKGVAEVTADKSSLDISYAPGDSQGSVTRNISLPVSGANKTAISWASSNPAVISVTGAVYRPPYTDADINVTLTATLSLYGISDTKQFDLTVRKYVLSDMEAVTIDAAALQIFAPGDSEIRVTGNLNLPSAGQNGTRISWTSDKPAYVSVTGSVYRPSYTVGDQLVTVTASVYKNSASVIRKFVVNVIKQPQTPEEAVEQDIASISIGYAQGDSQNSVTKNLTFPTAGGCGTAITWQSGSPSVISSTGVVHRPEYAQGDAVVTVTASVYKTGAAARTRNFTLTVLKKTADNDASLSGLLVGGLTLEPVFDKNITSYSINVPYNTSSLTISPLKSNVYSVIKINGIVLTSGSKSVELNTGSNIITIEVTAEDGVTKKTYTITAFRSSSDGGSSGNSGNSGTSGNNPAAGTNTNVNITVNGQDQGVTASVKQTNDGGRPVTTITVNSEKLSEVLTGGKQNPIVSIPVNTNSDVAVVELDSRAVGIMEQKQAVMEMKTDFASYSLPAEQINVQQAVQELGNNVDPKDIQVKVEIARSSQETVQVMENSSRKGEFTIVAPPVDFKITYSHGNKTVEVNRFSSYVERTIAIPAGIDPSKITTGVILNSDGTISHVPTKIIIIDGKYYAKINSLTNSTYSVIWNPRTFKDVEAHWARDIVNDMGSRMIISGIDKENYAPGRDITRAEFAAIIVKALGLKSNSKNSRFSDVGRDDWFFDAVNTAYEYSIVGGYEDATFKPNKAITRLEAMVMIVKAMKLAGIDTTLNDTDAEKYLGRFSDRHLVDSWAARSAAVCIQNGVVTGNEGALMPADNITRAETAVIIYKMLKKAELI